MFELPLRAFCLTGNNGADKIEMTMNEVFGFPEQTTFEGGYDFKGTLSISVGSYKVHSENLYSSTGALHSFNISLIKCCDTLSGTANYARMYEKNLEFKVKMTTLGHAIIAGEFRECSHLLNILLFEIPTDQTCIWSAIDDLKRIERLFGGYKGKRTE